VSEDIRAWREDVRTIPSD